MLDEKLTSDVSEEEGGGRKKLVVEKVNLW
jgi:hypothetical protein